jgi:hypothetical protein
MAMDWIVANDATHGADAYAMECRRCGAKQRFVLPIAISVWCAAAKAFERQHATCLPVSQGLVSDLCRRPGARP